MHSRSGAAALRLAGVVAAAAVVCALLYRAWPLLYPFALGWLLAYSLNPFVKGLHYTARLPRPLAVTVTLLLFAVSMLTIVSALIVRLVAEIVALSGSLEHSIDWFQSRLESFLSRPQIIGLVDRLNAFYRDNPNYRETIDGRLSHAAQTIADFGTGLIGAFLNGVTGLLLALPQIATIAVIVLLASFFISLDWDSYGTKAAAWFPPALRKRAGVIRVNLHRALSGYIRAQLILISITTLSVTVGLLLLGVDNALSIGLLIGFIDLLPYLGVGAVMIPWIVYTFLNGDSQLGVGLSVLCGIVLIARQILEPKVLSSNVGLRPLPTMIAMFAGLKLFGFAGLIIGPAAIIVLSTCYRAGVFHDIGRFIATGRL